MQLCSASQGMMNEVDGVQEPSTVDRPVIVHGLEDVCGGSFSHAANKLWIYDENCVQLIDARSGLCVQKWNYRYGKITNVYEVVLNANYYLTVVAVLNSKEKTGDVIILLNISSLSVVKSFYLEDKVAIVESISCASFQSNLQKFEGILAVGCYGGKVLLINARLTEWGEEGSGHPLRVENDDENGTLELLQGM